MLQRGLLRFTPTEIILTHERKVQKHEAMQTQIDATSWPRSTLHAERSILTSPLSFHLFSCQLFRK